MSGMYAEDLNAVNHYIEGHIVEMTYKDSTAAMSLIKHTARGYSIECDAIHHSNDRDFKAIAKSPLCHPSHYTFSYTQNSVNMPSLIELLTPRYAPMQSYILSCLDIGDIVTLSRTCKALTTTLSTFKALNFNINEHLKI